jgi:hypothetical protein
MKHPPSALRSLPRMSQEAAVGSRVVRAVAPGRYSRLLLGHRRLVPLRDRDYGIACGRAIPGGRTTRIRKAEAGGCGGQSLTAEEAGLRHDEAGLVEL